MGSEGLLQESRAHLKDSRTGLDGGREGLKIQDGKDSLHLEL